MKRSTKHDFKHSLMSRVACFLLPVISNKIMGAFLCTAKVMPSWQSKGTPPMPRLPQEIAGPNKALLRETNG